jgi:hypothetical protein
MKHLLGSVVPHVELVWGSIPVAAPAADDAVEARHQETKKEEGGLAGWEEEYQEEGAPQSVPSLLSDLVERSRGSIETGWCTSSPAGTKVKPVIVVKVGWPMRLTREERQDRGEMAGGSQPC